MRRDADFPAKPEKCLLSWCAGCWAGDDYALGVQEVLDTQALNTRSAKEKTYHLIVSFHPEDETRLTPETFKAIEQRFAEALGLSAHQRHCGVHGNTENMHLHVAYNLIHPERLMRVEPWRDYIKRDRLCRELEKEYGLVIDNGREQARGRGPGDKAAIVEAHTGCQSFESYARDQGAALLDLLKQARTWEEAHQAFARRGLEVKPRGAGLVVKNRHGRQMTKASAVHRDLTLKKLAARFGAFQPATGAMPESESRYSAKPLHKAPNRAGLWDAFQEQRRMREEAERAIRSKWKRKREELERRPLARRIRVNLTRLARQYEADELHAARMERPGAGNWLDFLRHRAAHGDETALAVLRSRNQEVEPESVRQLEEQMRDREIFLAGKTAILENAALSARTKNRLTGMALMESLAEGTTSRISKHGSVIYTVPGGGKICDTGKQISFTPDARTTALAYMSAKWGVKRRTVNAFSGEVAYILADGRKVIQAEKHCFERPDMGRRRAQDRSRER